MIGSHRDSLLRFGALLWRLSFLMLPFCLACKRAPQATVEEYYEDDEIVADGEDMPVGEISQPVELGKSRLISFVAQITVNEGGRIEVLEEYQLDVDESSSLRGVRRGVPSRLMDSLGTNRFVNLHLMQMHRNEEMLPLRMKSYGDFLNLEFGAREDPLLEPGINLFRAHYQANGVPWIVVEQRQVELYWNVTGRWPVPIDSVEVLVELPRTVDPAGVEILGVIRHRYENIAQPMDYVAKSELEAMARRLEEQDRREKEERRARRREKQEAPPPVESPSVAELEDEPLDELTTEWDGFLVEPGFHPDSGLEVAAEQEEELAPEEDWVPVDRIELLRRQLMHEEQQRLAAYEVDIGYTEDGKLRIKPSRGLLSDEAFTLLMTWPALGLAVR